MAYTSGKIPTDSIDVFFNAISDVDIDDPVIFLTWSPRPSTLDYASHLNYARHCHEMFYDIHSACSKFCITPELGDNFNIHYHMWLVITDHFRLYRYIIPRMKRSGFVKINKCHTKFLGPSYPYAYHLKENYIMESIIYPYPIPYTHNNYKNINNLIKYTININLE